MKYIAGPCTICRENKPNQILNTLRHINCLLRHVESTENYKNNFNWNINFKCKYGLHCNKFSQTEYNINLIINDIENKLVTVAKSDDNSLYYNVLNSLKPYFMHVCRELENIHRLR